MHQEKFLFQRMCFTQKEKDPMQKVKDTRNKKSYTYAIND